MPSCLKILLIALLVISSASARAVDRSVSHDAPDLAKTRALIKAENFKAAIVELNALMDRGVEHADVYNLLGFSLRKSGDLKNAATYYRKALDFDPNHTSALEYQGELFLMTKDIARARQNLARLVALCPAGCEEREDLEKSIRAAIGSN